MKFGQMYLKSNLAPFKAFMIMVLMLAMCSACNKNCDSCQIVDETGNLSETGKVCDSDFVEECQELAKRYKHITCDCQFQR